MAYYLKQPPTNPLSQILTAVLGIVVLLVAVTLGFFIIAGFLAVGLVFFIALRLRIAFLRWKNRAGSEIPEQQAKGTPPRQGVTIETEYTVVSSRKEDSSS